MKIFEEREWDWEDRWALLFWAAAWIAVATLATTVIANKELRSYYLDAQGQKAICVSADWTWHQDPVVFCTDDRERALDFVKRANETLVKK